MAAEGAGVWEDDQVFLSYNAIDCRTIDPRHGAEAPANYAPVTRNLDEMTDEATK